MKLELPIYDGKKVVKKYESSDAVLKTGVCEDILKIVDIDKLMGGSLDKEKLGMEIIKIAAVSMTKFKPMMMDVFEGLTEEEFRDTNIKDVVNVIVKIVQYTIGELFNIGGNSKN